VGFLVRGEPHLFRGFAVRKLLITLAFLLFAVAATAQNHTANIFTNYDLDAVAFVFCDPTDIPALMPVCVTGVAAEDGWIPVNRHVNKVLGIAITTIGVTGGLDIQIQVRVQEDDGTMSPAIILMNLINKTVAATDNQFVRLPDEVTQFRLGMEIGTADDGGDAIVEDIDVIYNAR